MSRKVAAILGCGPAGLLAAHAAAMEGYQPTIYARGPKSVIHGAQFLHVPIPDVTSPEPDGALRFEHWGVCEEYAMKVYGDAAAPCSWRAFGDEVPIWSMQRAYNELWDLYGLDVIYVDLMPSEIAQVEDTFEIIISTIPAQALCMNELHNFEHATVWVTNTAQERVPYNSVVLNGVYGEPWYRSSDILGTGQTEWPGTLFDYQISELSADQRVRVQKPLATDCTCRPHIVRAGRFGEWKKGVLVHHAFEKTQEVLRAL